MKWLYQTSIVLYGIGLQLASPFHPKANLFVKGRKNWRQRLRFFREDIGQHAQLAWFHCSSLGEFEQARPVIEGFRSRYPEWKILLTFFSPSGYEVRKSYNQADLVCYLPLDTKGQAEDFLSIIRPTVAYFCKYDYWYHYLTGLRERKVACFLFSATFRKSQPFFKGDSKSIWREMLRCFTHIFVQDERSEKLLDGILINRVSIAGDTRADRVMQNTITPFEDDVLTRWKESLAPSTQVLVVGSAWPEDTDLLLNYLIAQRPDLAILIAPHELKPVYYEQLSRQVSTLSQSRRECFLHSQIDGQTKLTGNPVIILDSMGKLSYVYRYGNLAYIGGGFGSGIHNTLEAAAYGLPVIFGPKYDKFLEAKQLIQQGAAVSIENMAALQEAFDRWLGQPLALEAASEAARQYVVQSTGASDKVLNLTAEVLSI